MSLGAQSNCASVTVDGDAVGTHSQFVVARFTWNPFAYLFPVAFSSIVSVVG